MELKYSLTQAEFVAMGMRESRRNHPPPASIYLAIGLVMLSALLLVARSTHSPLAGVTAAAAVPVLLVSLFRRIVRMKWVNAYNAVKRDEDARVIIDSVGFTVEKTHARGEVQWELIQELREDDLGFYLTYGKMQSLYVPRRVFANAEEAQRFWSLTNSYVAHVKDAADWASQFEKRTEVIPIRFSKIAYEVILRCHWFGNGGSSALRRHQSAIQGHSP